MDGIPTSVAAGLSGALAVRPGRGPHTRRTPSASAPAAEGSDSPPEASDKPVEGMEETPRLFEQLPPSPQVRPGREGEPRPSLDIRA